jgi:hypothetical protein
LDLTDAKVGGSVHLEGSTFGPGTRPAGLDSSPAGCPVRLNRVDIKGSLIALGIACHGMVDLSNARIGADVELDGASVSAPAGTPDPIPATAIHAPNIYVGGSFTADPNRPRTRRTITHAGLGSADATVALVPPQRRLPEQEPISEQPAPAAMPTLYGPLRVTGRLYLADAHIGADIDLTGAQLTMPNRTGAHPSADPLGPTLDAQHDANAVLVLDRAQIDGNAKMDQQFTADGLIRMVNAKVHGDLRFNSSTLMGRGAGATARTYSLLADAVEIDGQVDGSGSHVTGEIRLRDARIGHNMYLREAVIGEPGGNSLNLERAQVGGALDCTRLRGRGSLRLLDLTCGPVVLNGAHLTDPCTAEDSSPSDTADEQHDPVLDFSGAHITGSVEAGIAPASSDSGTASTRPFTAEGAAHLRDARVSRAVLFTAAHMRSPAQYSFDAAGLVATDLSLEEAEVIGTVRIADTRVSGSLNFANAILGDRAPVEEAVRRHRLSRWIGRVRAFMRRANRTSPTAIVRRPPMSLDAGSARVGGTARFDGLYAQHTVSLRRATVMDTVDMQDVTLADRRFALDLAGLHVPDIRLSPANRLIGRVDLARLVTITLMDNDNLWAADEIDAWGIEFGILIDADSATRVRDPDPLRRMLKRLDRTRFLLPPYYDRLEREVIAPKDPLLQPYQQLARMYRALGKDGQARKVLYRMRRREWHQQWSTDGVRSKLLWLGGLFYNASVGFGYRLSRAFYWLLLLWVAGWICFAHYATGAHPSPPIGASVNSSCTISNNADPVPMQPGYCGTFDPALYTIDLILPVVDLGQASAWHFRNVQLQLAADLLRVAGWLLASAVATAALNLVGRDSDAHQPTEPRWAPD